MKEEVFLYQDFTFRLRGLLFEVQNELGHYCNEKQYGDSFENKLKKEKIEYRREFILPQSFEGERFHRNRVDFIVKKEKIFIIIELKVVSALTRDDYYQCQRYLQALNLDLALLVNFRPKYIMIKRLLNVEKYHREKNQ